MTDAAARGGGLRVFLSYARADGAALADELFAGLELLGFEPLLDRHDIAAGEDWERRLDGLIRSSDTVLFLLSPQAARSPRCRWEVERALALSKRLVPVVAAAVPEADVPEPLRRLNYVFFDGGRSFARSLGQLADALRTDLEWIREHTRITELAMRWDQRRRDEALLLRGVELAAAQSWMQGWRAGAPDVGPTLRAFIDAASEAETRRNDAERQRNEQMAQANAAAAEALATREQAVRRLRRLTIGGGLGGVLLSGGLAYAGWSALRTQRELKAVQQQVAEAMERSRERLIEAEAMRTDIVGQVTAYATAPGEMAMDDSGFTPGLIEQLDVKRVSLWDALQQVTRQVLAKTRGEQRPYIASDMNGDLWYRRSPPTRRRRALVLSFDGAGIPGMFALPGIARDATLWVRFFEACSIPVQWLRNPTRPAMLDAVQGLRVAAAAAPDGLLRRVGAKAPDRPASAAEAAAGAAAAGPEPNTFLTLVYVGMGFRIDGQDCLGAVDSQPWDKDVEAALRSTLRVADAASALRRQAAASCMVLDTMFAGGGRRAK